MKADGADEFVRNVVGLAFDGQGGLYGPGQVLFRNTQNSLFTGFRQVHLQKALQAFIANALTLVLGISEVLGTLGNIVAVL